MWPDTKGKHPLALITPGTPRNHEEIPKRTAMLFFAQAMEFARRGFGVAVVMRKGFGHSGGGLSRYLNDSCTSPPYLLRTKQASNDLKEAISYLSSMPQFDTSKTIVIGVSTGGLAILGLTAFPPEPKDGVVVAGINFAGGSGSYSNGRICGGESALISVFKELGKTSRIPSLWIYSKNDLYFGPNLANQLYEAFNLSGGKANLVIAEPYQEDGHNLFNKGGISIWTPIIDKFLKEQNLQLLKEMLPPPENKKISIPKELAEKYQSFFQTYLEDAPHKAFAISKKGGYGRSNSQYSKEMAIQKAIDFCNKSSKSECEVYDSD